MYRAATEPVIIDSSLIFVALIMDNRPFRKRLKYSALYYFVRFLIFSSGIIPRTWWLSLCGALGKLTWHIMGDTRRLAIESLTIAYGHEKSEREIRKLSKRVFVMIGRNGGDILRARNVKSLAQMNKIVELKGYEHFEAAAAKGKGVIFLGSHLGAFDLEVNALSLRGWTPHIIGTALKDERLNDLLFSYRERFGAVAIERGKETMRLIRALKKNESLAILIDQDTKVKSRFVNFFGRPAATPVGASILAMKSGAAVVPSAIYLGKDNIQHMEIFPEIPMVDTGDEEFDMVTNTQLQTDFIEARIREHPEQWLWIHARWKTRPGEELR